MPETDSFDARDLEQRFAFLDDCPADLLAEVVTLAVGSLEARVAGIRQWRDALLDGRLPAPGSWPPPPIADPVRRALSELGLVRFCKGQADLVDALLRDIIRAFVSQAGVVQADVAARLRELEELERKRLAANVPKVAKQRRQSWRRMSLDSATRGRLLAEAERDVSARERAADADIMAAWGERARLWAELADVFGDLGELMGRGWDLSLGVLRHTGWMELLRLKKLVEQLPQVRDIIRSLGRLQDGQEGESVAERLLLPVRRLEEEQRDVVSPHIPAETRGVERSGEIARMLPVEASMLGHPKLKLLWHARRSERALLTYRVEGVKTERVWTERESRVEVAVEGKRPRPERGPIISVIDTSGSMHGLPEQVAKAVVLEALRTAHAERRRCFLYSYSGPEQIVEHELDLSQDGIGRLLAFLGLSFGGGNDETGVLARVLDRLESDGWTKADVLFVSDGEWPAPHELLKSIRTARKKGTRFHGVQIGNRGTTGLHAVCEPVHVFADWEALGGWR